MGAIIGITVGIAGVVYGSLGPRQQRRADWFFFVPSLLGAAVAIADRSTFGTIANGSLAGFFAWLLWTGRNRKDRKPSRILGVVRDLGHRLTVQPIPARSE